MENLENRFIMVENIKTFEVSSQKSGKYFRVEAFCGKSAAANSDLPLIGHQCSHKDNNSAHHSHTQSLPKISGKFPTNLQSSHTVCEHPVGEQPHS